MTHLAHPTLCHSGSSNCCNLPLGPIITAGKCKGKSKARPRIAAGENRSCDPLKERVWWALMGICSEAEMSHYFKTNPQPWNVTDHFRQSVSIHEAAVSEENIEPEVFQIVPTARVSEQAVPVVML